jgi:secreted trypsin-like serine protease
MFGSLGRGALTAGVLVLASLGVRATTAQAIVGGQPIPVSQAPWTVAVGASGPSCSGSILDATHVLTAEHCVMVGTTPVAGLLVADGTSNVMDPKQGGRVAVAGVRAHPTTSPAISARTMTSLS